MKQCSIHRSPLVVGIFAILVVCSCQKKTEEASSTKKYATIENLQTAYAAEIRRYRWYSRFVQQAEKDRLINVASLFKAVAASEKIHADNHANQIRTMGAEVREQPVDSIPVGTTRQTLKLALSTESFECESLYPMLIRTAEIEKLHDVVTQFVQTQKADARHRELFKNAADFSGNIPQVQYRLCPVCGYIVTSGETEFCPICSTKKERFGKI